MGASTLLLALLALVLAAGCALGARHLYLRADRPGGFSCSLRVVDGTISGLNHRFRAGYAGRELDGFVWHRLAWRSPPVHFSAASVRLDRERAPRHGEHLVSVPASFAVLPVELPDGARLELALPRRHLRRITAALP